MIKIREVNPDDIITANEWRIDWGGLPLEDDMHPTTGLVLEDTETKELLYIGYTWFPQTSKMAQIGFIVRNKFYSNKKLAKQNKEPFILELISYCYKHGYKYIVTWAENPILVNVFKKIGFTETSNRTSELIIKITE